MVVLRLYDKEGKLVKELNLKDEDLVNPRFKRKNSVLDLFLDRGVQMQYGCMGGSCSACVCELVKGKEFVDKEGIHEQVYMDIGENDFLTCIATVKEGLASDALIELKAKL